MTVLRDALQKNPKLKLILMSATLESNESNEIVTWKHLKMEPPQGVYLVQQG